MQNKEIDLLGMGDEGGSTANTSTGGSAAGGDLLDSGFGSQAGPKAANIKVPFSEVVSPATPSVEKKITGLKIEAAFQREGAKVFLELRVTNQMQTPIGDLAIKFNANSFKIQPDNPEVPIPKLDPGAKKEGRVSVNFNGATDNQVPICPFKIQAALKTSVDIFIFFVP